jgi:hypothetical protein
MLRKINRWRLSPGEELFLGIALFAIAIVFLWSNLGQTVLAIVEGLGVALVVHAAWRFVRQRARRRRIGGSTMLVLVLLCGGVWLSHPAVSHAAVGGIINNGVRGGGQWDTTSVWSKVLPNGHWTGCLSGSGYTEGTYPSLNVDLSGWTISYRETYKFSMGIKVCVYIADSLGVNRKFKYWHIIKPRFSDVDGGLIQNPRYDKTEAVWDPVQPGCLNIRVKGLATLIPLPLALPILDKIFPIVSTTTIHFWVDFHDVCTDLSVGAVQPDGQPY